jgi:glycosyltransferase involved in cell wall biosynthesis
MARIVIADRTNHYDGRDVALRPLGGTEMSVISLAEALSRRGHIVTCLTHCDERVSHQGVTWSPLQAESPGPCDLFLAVQHPDLLDLVRRPRRRALWLVWPPHNLRKRLHFLRMWLYRPLPIFVSPYQVSIYWRFLPTPDPLLILPFGLPAAVRGRPPLDTPPPPHAIFASNPMRDLKWLLGIWERQILPQVPGAELHIYGIRDYAHRYADRWEETHKRLGQFVPEGHSAEAIRSLNPHPPARREELWDAMYSSRVMLYGGHRVEAFCLAVAEAQALGVPAVVRPIAVMPERVRDGVTGFVASDDETFVRHSVELLTDDVLWRRQHVAALSLQHGWSWDEMAAAFEASTMTGNSHN